MSWYVAKIVFQICNEGHPQFDEHLRLINAAGFEEAFLKARIIGLTEEDQFINDRQQAVKWEFVNVSELLPLAELKDGLEVYSQIKETERANEYVHYIHQKAASLQMEHSPVF